jgi:hypothetical protein
MGFANRTEIYSGKENEQTYIKISVLLFFADFKKSSEATAAFGG